MPIPSRSLSANGPLASVFCPDGLPLEAGTIVKNPALADTLEKIARGGPDVFYRGEIAEAIVAETAASGGFLSKTDLADYRAILREPVRGKYRGVTVLSGPPPVGGAAVIEALQILDRFRVRKGRPLAPETVHAVAESLKRPTPTTTPSSPTPASSRCRSTGSSRPPTRSAGRRKSTGPG